MSFEGLKSREIYERFKKSLPTSNVGYRGQAAHFTEVTLIKGFQKPRNYQFVDFSLINWNYLRLQKRSLEGSFNSAVDYGKSLSIQDEQQLTPRQLLDIFIDHPEKYSTVLALYFPETADKRFTDIKRGVYPPYQGTWMCEALPVEIIYGVVILSPLDFQEIVQRLDKREELTWFNIDLILRKRMMKAYLRTLNEPRKLG